MKKSKHSHLDRRGIDKETPHMETKKQTDRDTEGQAPKRTQLGHTDRENISITKQTDTDIKILSIVTKRILVFFPFPVFFVLRIFFFS